MKSTTKRRRRKIRNHQIKSPDDDGLSHILPQTQQMHLKEQPKVNNHYHHQSVLPTHLIILYCLMIICLSDNLNPSLLQVPHVVQAAPGALNHHLSKIASMVTGSSTSSSSPESVTTATLTSAASSVPTSSFSSSTPITSATLVKSARLATYSLTCPPEASIHPCTCLYHMPGALIESDEEEIYEISSAITTPIAEQLIMTSSSSTTTATSLPPSTTTTETTPSPPPTQQPQRQGPLAYHAELDQYASDQIPTTTTSTTTHLPTVEESNTTASPAAATTTTTTTTTTTPSPPPTQHSQPQAPLAYYAELDQIPTTTTSTTTRLPTVEESNTTASPAVATTTTTTTTTITPSPPPSQQSQPQAPLAYHTSDQISTTTTPTTTCPPSVEESNTTASSAATATTTTTQPSSSSIAPPNVTAQYNATTIEPVSTSISGSDGDSNSSSGTNNSSVSGLSHPQELFTQIQPQLQVQEQHSPPVVNDLKVQTLPALEQQPQQVVVGGGNSTTSFALVNSTTEAPADIPFSAPVASMTTAAPAAGLISLANTSQAANQSMSDSNSPVTPKPTMSTTTVAHQTTIALASTTVATKSTTVESASTTTEPPLPASSSSTTTTRAPISTSTAGNQLAPIGASTPASSTLSNTPTAAPASSFMRIATAPSTEAPPPTSSSSTPPPSAQTTQSPIHKTAATAPAAPSPAPTGAAPAALFATLSNVTHPPSPPPPPPASPSPLTAASSLSSPASTSPAALASIPTANSTTGRPISHAQASSSGGHPAQATYIGSGASGKDHTSAPSHSSPTTNTTTTTRAPQRASASAGLGTSVKPTMSTISTTTTAAPSLHPTSSVGVGGSQAKASGRASSSGRAIQSRHASPVTNPTAAQAQATSSSPSTPALPPSHPAPTPTHSPTTSPALAQHHQSSAAPSQQKPAQTQAQAQINGGSGRQILTPSSHRLRPGLHRHRSPALNSASTPTTTTTPHPLREARAVSSTEAATAEQSALLPSTERSPGSRRLTRYLAHQDGSGGFFFGGDTSGEPKPEVMAFCRNIQNPQVLRDAIKGFRGHQINYFVIDSCRVPPFPNDLFVGIDVRWLEMTNSTVQFHNNFLHPRCNAAFELCARKPVR